MRVTGLCRGGMFPALEKAERRARIDDNRRAIEEAWTLGAECLVLVVGGLRPAPRTFEVRGRWSRTESPPSRTRPWPRACRSLIEPLHPMPGTDRREHRPSARPLRPSGNEGVGWRSTSTTSGGIRDRSPDRPRRPQAPARLPHLRLARTDEGPARGPRDDGRRRHRHPRICAGWSRRRAMPAATRSRSSRARTGGSATRPRSFRSASSATRPAAEHERGPPCSAAAIGWGLRRGQAFWPVASELLQAQALPGCGRIERGSCLGAG